MRVLIAGAGVAGTAMGIAARKAGLDPIIFEAYPESAGLDHGVYLTVAINGIDALAAIDADHVVRDHGFETNHITFSSGSGRRLGRLQLGPAMRDGTVTHTVRRTDLYRVLHEEAANRGVETWHGKKLVGAEEVDGRVEVRFEDGSTASGDLLVGADGVGSPTRRIIDPANPAPRYAGLGNTGGFTRIPGLEARPGDYEMVWGKRCFFGYTVAPDGEVWWFANPPARREPTAARLAGLESSQIKKALADLVADDRSPAAQIIASDRGVLRVTNQYDLPHVPTWRRGRMVIIGDAAHAVSPSSGQGCSLAVEDAVTLARCLRDLPDPEHALGVYESLRRNRVERIVDWGASMNNTKRRGSVAWALREFVLPQIFKKASGPARLEEMSWMYRHHIDWDTPVGDESRRKEMR
ncbi:MAG TPA: FAD-dependent monooxygenase [Acidimicrobiia bacterium]|nr:FAD-dependent monooxygenase [Acidimicrobiia bacterium]